LMEIVFVLCIVNLMQQVIRMAYILTC
jgi:hypothetical protein